MLGSIPSMHCLVAQGVSVELRWLTQHALRLQGQGEVMEEAAMPSGWHQHMLVNCQSLFVQLLCLTQLVLRLQD